MEPRLPYSFANITLRFREHYNKLTATYLSEERQGISESASQKKARPARERALYFSQSDIGGDSAKLPPASIRKAF
jgi:hypothetical protein